MSSSHKRDAEDASRPGQRPSHKAAKTITRSELYASPISDDTPSPRKKTTHPDNNNITNTPTVAKTTFVDLSM